MKKINLLKLSLRNLFSNFTRSILVLIAITLLSVAIILVCNTAHNIYKPINEYSKCIIKNGVNFKFYKDFIGEDTEKFKKESYEFINDSKEVFNDIKFNTKSRKCTFKDNEIEIFSFVTGDEDNYTLISGEKITPKDLDTNNIWISEAFCNEYNFKVGDTFMIYKCKFIVKGITKSKIITSYTNPIILNDYVVIYAYDSTKTYDMGKMKQISKFFDLAKKKYQSLDFCANQVASYDNVTKLMNVIVAFTVVLICVCSLLSISTIINSIKISTEENNNTIGVFKSLGMKNKDIYLYIMLQVLVLIFIGTLIGGLIAYLINNSITNMLSGFKKNTFIGAYNIKFYFNFYLPIINLFICTGFVFLASLKSLRKYTKTSVVDLMQEVD